jgi:hypothetical protein
MRTPGIPARSAAVILLLAWPQRPRYWRWLLAALATALLHWLVVLWLYSLPPRPSPRAAQPEPAVLQLLSLPTPPPEYIEANPLANTQAPAPQTSRTSFQDQQAAQAVPQTLEEDDLPQVDGSEFTSKIVETQLGERPSHASLSQPEVLPTAQKPLPTASETNSAPVEPARPIVEASPAQEVLPPSADETPVQQQRQTPSADIELEKVPEGTGLLQAVPELPEVPAAASQPGAQAVYTRPSPVAGQRPRPTVRVTDLPSAPLRHSETSAPRIGLVAADARWSSFGAYQQKMTEAVGRHWHLLAKYLDLRHDRGTRVRVRFLLHADGSVSQTQVLATTASSVATLTVLNAVESPAPFAPWPSDMAATLQDPQPVTFTFHYE